MSRPHLLETRNENVEAPNPYRKWPNVAHSPGFLGPVGVEDAKSSECKGVLRVDNISMAPVLHIRFGILATLRESWQAWSLRQSTIAMIEIGPDRR